MLPSSTALPCSHHPTSVPPRSIIPSDVFARKPVRCARGRPVRAVLVLLFMKLTAHDSLQIPKRVENFIFFTIAGNGAAFRKVVGSQAFLALITSAA